MADYGRHRQSLADIEEQLQSIFLSHPKTHRTASGEPVIPAGNLVDIFQAFSQLYNGVELLTPTDIGLLDTLLQENPGLEVTPQILLSYIAQKTKQSPPRSPVMTNSERERADSSGSGGDAPRGRSFIGERDSYGSSDDDSSGRQHREPSQSRLPQTPGAKSSIFDSEKRQRSTPLGNNAPSSWATKKPAPAGRRKSDAGSRSDSDSYGGSPSAYGGIGGSRRIRAPSNPTSPTPMSPETHPTTFTAPFGRSTSTSRPHSRARSQPQNQYNRAFSPGYDDDLTIGLHNSLNGISPNNSFSLQSTSDAISSLPLPPRPRSPGHSDDSDDEEEEGRVRGLVMERSTASSTVSLEPMDRVDVLQRANLDLGRKLVELEKTLQNRLEEHEVELEEMTGRLEEVRGELAATKREEKELRGKERQNMTQISALEAEVAKVSKALDQARISYASLQRQYQEQCSVSEKYRDDLRQREETVRGLRDTASLHDLENAKVARERETYEARIFSLEGELDIAQQAHAQLDEQKQENLLLKETIDRMRFDMDEMRSNAAAGGIGGGIGSGRSSMVGSIGKSLGAELMKGGWLGQDDDDHDEHEKDNEDGDDTEEEDYTTETIITKTLRKRANRTNKSFTGPKEVVIVKELADASTQYDPSIFASNSSTQTDAPPITRTVTISTQTPAAPVLVSSTTQTPQVVPTPPRVLASTEIQTDSPPLSRSPSPTPTASGADESLASSSSTIVPPTPKPVQSQLTPDTADQPPAYTNIHNSQDVDENWRLTAEVIKKWHGGVGVPFTPIPGGVSQEAVDEWVALKDELGVECGVIDKLIASSERTTTSQSHVHRASGSSASASATTTTTTTTTETSVVAAGKQRRGRFFNIYNTYVYGNANGASGLGSGSRSGLLLPGLHTVLWMGAASAMVLVAVSPYLTLHPGAQGGTYMIPGGPTYYDRAAWQSFNTMHAAGEGFAPLDGTAAVWNFLGRVGGGAARMARG